MLLSMLVYASNQPVAVNCGPCPSASGVFFGQYSGTYTLVFKLIF